MGPVTFLHEQKRRVAFISLFVFIMTLVLLLLSGTSIAEFIARATEAPFVYILQRPDQQFGNVAHSFVIKGYPGSTYEWATFLDLCWAFARFFKADLLLRLLSLPLAYYHFSMFCCVATAESRIRRLKGKKVRWEEYLRLYMPVSVKAGFFTASASLATASILADGLAPRMWLLYPLVLGLQLCYFLVVLYCALAFTSVVLLLSCLYGYYAQPVRLPVVTSLLPTILVLAQVLRWAAEPLARQRESRLYQPAVRFIVACNKVEESLMRVGEHVVKRIRAVSGVVEAMLQRVVDRLPKVKLTFTGSSTARSDQHSGTITPSSATSNSQPGDLPSKQKLQQAMPSVATSPPSKLRTASPVCKPQPVLPAAASPAHPWALCVLVCTLVTTLLASDIFTAKPVGHILRFGEMMRVGDTRQYRCSLRDWLTSSRCRSLDLVLQTDGTLRLYEHAGSSSEEPRLLWTSNSGLGTADGYAAQLDEKARLVVSLDDKVVYRTPRLVRAAEKASAKAVAPELSLDGHMGGFYITPTPVEPSVSEVVPTFASTW